MRKTYVTRMPDKAGAFLLASRIIAEEGGNITRVNYNRAVDTHTLFLEVTASELQLDAIETRLTECGYLSDGEDSRRILMIVLTLPDVPGAVEPALELLGQHDVNISYISAQENGTPYQYFKMGLLIEDPDALGRLIEALSRVCPIRILDYEVTDRFLDGTVFYVSFANEMRGILGLSQAQTNDVLIYANQMMQMLDEQNKSSLQTFDYIRRFARFVMDRKGEDFNAKVTTLRLADELLLYVVEPPCGSNTYILRYRDELLFVDCGFAVYKYEMLNLIGWMIPDFPKLRRKLLLTHADVDHVGLQALFEAVYMNRSCYDNFVLQQRGEPDFREQIPAHAPYCALSKIITRHEPPDLKNAVVYGSRRGDGELFERVGALDFGEWRFDLYEGPGGHVRGETVIVCEALRLVFTGDIYVNIKGFTDEQREFNSLAPFLMTGVDADPALARKCREVLLKEYEDYLLCPGHGAVQEQD